MKTNIDIGMVENGNLQLIETIKLLLYKFDESIFDQLDFDRDEIYSNPLLFAFFNSDVKKKELLRPLIFSYTEENDISVYSDNSGRIYIPNTGWLLTTEKDCEYTLNQSENGLELKKDGVLCPYVFEPIEYIPNTRIELLKYPVPLLAPCYYDVDGNLINVEIEQITDKQRAYLQKGFELIQKYVPEHFNLIEQVTRQIVIFNVDTFLRNSFATTLAHGVAFFNACQDGYNEVFFVDEKENIPEHLINRKKIMKRMNGVNARDKFPLGIKLDESEQKTTENFTAEYVDEDYEVQPDDERFGQGVSVHELMKVGNLLQQESVNEIQEKEAVEVMQKIQGTELYGLLENSIGEVSKRIATLLDRNLKTNESSDFNTQNRFDKFNIDDFI